MPLSDSEVFFTLSKEPLDMATHLYNTYHIYNTVDIATSSRVLGTAEILGGLCPCRAKQRDLVFSKQQ